jgi:hypothetical protein
MAPRPPIIGPTQQLPRLTMEGRRLADPELLPGRLALDPWVKDTLRDRRANVVIGTAQTFAPGFIDEIDKKFRPVKRKDGMGCMEACYGVLAILFTEKVSKELLNEVIRRAFAKAEARAKREPDKLKEEMAEAKAADPKLTDKAARKEVIERWASPHNTSDHLYRLMGERGMAEAKVNSPNAKAEETIRGMTGDLPGLFLFGLAVNDNHTVTLAVERAADGSQRMYWLDQNQPGLSREIEAGQLGTALQRVQGFTTSTNIYPFLPPTAGGA